MTVREQHERWGELRKKGFKHFLLKSFVVMFKYTLIMYFVFVAASVFFESISYGFNLDSFLDTLKVFTAVFAALLLSPTLSYLNWKEKEKKYLKFMESEKHTEHKPEIISSNEKEYTQYRLLKIFTFLSYALPAAVITVWIAGYIIGYKYTLHIMASTGILFFVNIEFVTRYFKNPICKHRIYSVDEKKRHPDAKGSYIDNLWNIFRYNKFSCIECSTDYYFYNKNGIDMIVKK